MEATGAYAALDLVRAVAGVKELATRHDAVL
jgi:hypothetical protein